MNNRNLIVQIGENEMLINEIISKVNIDNKTGIGAVPKNADVDYFGIAVKMKPSTFLSLAHFLSKPKMDSIRTILTHLKSGNPIGAPFLEIEAPDQWRKSQDFSIPAKIVGHEGRHRMRAIQELYGDIPVEVHLFLRSKHYEWRNRHITPEVLQELNRQLFSEDDSNSPKKGPFFTI